MSPCRVLLVDDTPEFIALMRTFLLARFPEIEIVGTAESGDEALARLDELNADLILVDFSMPGMNGLETIRAAKTRLRPPKAILLSGYDGPEYHKAAAAAGADGFIYKPDVLSALPPLLHSMLEG